MTAVLQCSAVIRFTSLAECHVDLAGLDIGQEPFQGWALQRAAGKAAVIIHVGNTVQPSCLCDRMKAAQASRWASRELNACSRPSSDDFRV